MNIELVADEALARQALAEKVLAEQARYGAPQTSGIETIVSLWRRFVGRTRRSPRQLRLCESLSLGERRFVAVVEFGNSRFLLGGTSASMVLLAELSGHEKRNPPAAQSRARGERI